MPSSRLHDALAARVDRGEFPGVVTLVARDDDVEVDAIGVTAFGGDVPMRRDTVFRIASLTKPIVAAATMILVEDDVIELEEPVTRLLPEMAGQRVLARIDGPLDETVPLRRPVTIEDLLTFRMGFGLITEPEFDPPYPINRAADGMRLALGEPDPRTPHGPDEWIKLFGSLPCCSRAPRAGRSATCCASGCSTRSAWPRPPSGCRWSGRGSCRRTT
jgi:CubicO group peptidase (beta-lactamase class C family)